MAKVTLLLCALRCEVRDVAITTDVAGVVVVALLPFELSLLLMAAVTEKFTRRIAQLVQEVFLVIYRSKGDLTRAV